MLAQTGLRASELTGLACGDIHLGTGLHINTIGKGRKQRITPLIKDTIAVLRVWLAERGSAPGDPLFPTSTGRPLTRKALARRIAKHAADAAERCPSLTAKTITKWRDAFSARRTPGFLASAGPSDAAATQAPRRRGCAPSRA
ncbi:MAG TPA: tyrosine-type recombinase/integrase [Baekduia sp.]|nr:tyrosine-type recombinase/integrase [Baekduia sp.]